MEEKRGNVVLFPFMAEGHIIPFLALAQHIDQQMTCNRIIFVNTPLNIAKLRKSIHPSSSSIKLVQIPFSSSDHGLPADSETSNSLPYSQSLRLLEASQSLKLPFKNLLSDLIQEQGDGENQPICVVSDIFLGWAADVAHELGIFHAIFSITGGFGLACYCSMWLNLPNKNTENLEFQLPDFPEAGLIHVTQLTPAVLAAAEDDPFTDFQRRNIGTWSNTDGFLFNTMEEVDITGLVYFRRKFGIPVWGIGPLLLPEQDRARIGREPTITADKCIEWMDKKAPTSVIYISFGPQNTITASQMMNLAKALDASGRNFIWVVRPPLGFDINSEFVAEEWLPEEFLQRIRDEDRGIIVKKWAPQVEILAHESVGAFISHCGWNSVLESLKNGVPIIGWPMAAEQFYNAKYLVEEVGVCVEVARGTNFEVRQEEIMEKIELVMGKNEKAEEIKESCCEIKEIFRDAWRNEEGYKGASVKSIQEFFGAALRKGFAVQTTETEIS